MPSYKDDTKFAIGESSSTLILLSDMKIPPPDQVIYNPASSYYVRADQSRVADGFPSVEWVWDTISISRLSLLLDFLDGEQYADVYIQTDKRDGTFPTPMSSFAVFSAIMLMPVLSGEEGVPVARSPYVMQTVQINFRKLIEQ